jgi:hypothetical protein
MSLPIGIKKANGKAVGDHSPDSNVVHCKYGESFWNGKGKGRKYI